MRTKEEKERINKKYGNYASKTPPGLLRLTEKAKETILNIIKKSNKQIIGIDTDCIWYKT